MLGDAEAGRRDLEAAAAALPWSACRGTGRHPGSPGGRPPALGTSPAPWQPPTKRSRWPKPKSFVRCGHRAWG